MSDYIDEMNEELYSDSLDSLDFDNKTYNEPLDMKDICSYSNYAEVYNCNGVLCTDGSKEWYVDSISYRAGVGFVFNLVEAEDY